MSIGTLSRNRLWGETSAVRTPHATTTLIRASADGAGPHDGEKRILVDPGLPGPALVARLFERTGLKPEDIDIVFLTTFRPAHRNGLEAFPNAKWLLPEAEHDAVHDHLVELRERGDSDVARVVDIELELLKQTRVPDDKLATQVDLFPLPGYTPGTCGLLIADAATTTLITGDAVPTRDHLLAAQLLPDTYDKAQAGESLQEVYEVADTIVPGHDNIFANPRSYGG